MDLANQKSAAEPARVRQNPVTFKFGRDCIESARDIIRVAYREQRELTRQELAKFRTLMAFARLFDGEVCHA